MLELEDDVLADLEKILKVSACFKFQMKTMGDTEALDIDGPGTTEEDAGPSNPVILDGTQSPLKFNFRNLTIYNVAPIFIPGRPSTSVLASHGADTPGLEGTVLQRSSQGAGAALTHQKTITSES